MILSAYPIAQQLDRLQHEACLKSAIEPTVTAQPASVGSALLQNHPHGIVEAPVPKHTATQDRNLRSEHRAWLRGEL